MSRFGVGATVGPLLGGVFTDEVTWRWCFYLNLPIGGFSILSMILFFKPKNTATSKAGFFERVLKLDLIGNMILLGAFVMLFLALQYSEQVGDCSICHSATWSNFDNSKSHGTAPKSSVFCPGVEQPVWYFFYGFGSRAKRLWFLCALSSNEALQRHALWHSSSSQPSLSMFTTCRSGFKLSKELALFALVST